MDQDQLLYTFAQTHSRTREWTEQLLNRIRAVRASRGSKRIDEINKLELEVMGKLYEAQHDSQLEEQIAQVYGNWIDQLKSQFPELTQEEQFLCCYLKMGLSTRQMALLQGIQVNSIKDALKRLGQKLDLTETIDLTTFIKSF